MEALANEPKNSDEEEEEEEQEENEEDKEDELIEDEFGDQKTINPEDLIEYEVFYDHQQVMQTYKGQSKDLFSDVHDEFDSILRDMKGRKNL